MTAEKIASICFLVASVLALVAAITSTVTIFSGGIVSRIRRISAVHRQMRQMRQAVCDGKFQAGADARHVAFAHDGDLGIPVASVMLSPEHSALLKKKYNLTKEQVKSCRWIEVAGSRLELQCDGADVDSKASLMPKCPADLGFQCRTSYAGYTVPRVRCVYEPQLGQG